jgi:DNA mismatch repair protein MutL
VSTADDLAGVHTLGFRGEALPSIAAVSRLRLRSRAADFEAGSEVYLVGGVVRKVKEVGCPVGTLVEVRDLFFNTPARRKFLKSATTEGAHLAEALLRLALARPQVAFRYQAGGRMVWDLPPTAELRVRVAALLGRRTAAEMVPVSVEKGPLRIRGLAGLPSLTRSGPEKLYLFVNGRYVRDRVLMHAVAEAYRGLIPADRRPVVVLHLELDPALVDVNVHPAKVEVRFHRAGEIHDALAQGLRQGLAEAAPRPAAPVWPAPAPERREAPSEAPRPERYSRPGAAAATQGAGPVRPRG